MANHAYVKTRKTMLAAEVSQLIAGMNTDVYLVNMLPECAVSPILPYVSKRADLKGQIPAVYNGKSAAEWYSLYCQTVLRTDRERGIRAELVDWLRQNAMFTCATCVRNGDWTGRQYTDLRMHNGTQFCRYCYMLVVWPDESVAPAEWATLPAFDPFTALL